MGILDDAIREHLELKRQHGAAEEELRQQEAEALGAPVDAQSEDAADLAEGNGGQAIPEEALEAEAPPEPELEPEPRSCRGARAPPEPEPEPEPQPTEPFEPDFAGARSRRARGHLPGQEEEEPPPPAATRRPAASRPSKRRRTKRTPPSEGDVLEDTPDFLQETPEHDRLWFEQKPPRDFDFD